MKYKQVVLFKAPSEQGEDKYSALLESAGFMVSLLPVIQFNYIQQTELRSALSDVVGYSGVLLTSTRAVQAIKRLEGFDKNVLRDKDMYVVGKATEALVEQSFGLACQGGGTGSAQALAEYIIKQNKSRKGKEVLLFPCSTLANQNLPKILGDAGIDCRRIDAYETTENAELKDLISSLKNLEVAVFFSPSGVESAMPYLSQSVKDKIIFIAIGETTRSSMLKHVGDALVCDKPSPESLLATLNSLCSLS